MLLYVNCVWVSKLLTTVCLKVKNIYWQWKKSISRLQSHVNFIDSHHKLKWGFLYTYE